MCGYCGCESAEMHQHEHGPAQDHHHDDSRLIQIEHANLSENQNFAAQNRLYFEKNHLLAFNLMSSPGSGKTTLLVETIKLLKSHYAIQVIEGDQQTDLDAKRIAATGVPVLQINTGKACHLDAHRVAHALNDLAPTMNSLIFIENVGNLVCPALFDLGEHAKIVILSVTEGDDKPLKYPHMFAEASLMVINKIDLLPYVSFDIEQCIAYAKRINPNISVLQTSATTQQGLLPWCQWLLRNPPPHATLAT
ncbi:MAG: hydrogenase nickel incorporation protein HypB [Gammaproteobacteria bacterium]|nr:hydrogenase nickel incorporation protein HypB [Gammaproteobacteria bacterium]